MVGKGGVSFQNFQKKRGGGGSEFSHKKGGVGVLKKGVSLTFILTSSFQCYLSLNVWCACLFIYSTSIIIICVSQEEPSLIASNQQAFDFYK